ncbi:MAG TPA: alpha/beta fold hydrolase [Candidatus Lumbricidophila sp.]|nr:alpha/beta fold hydrolase [Candidatus Lumbricidophila sp.]
MVGSPAGPCPAWLFGDARADTWGIHIHGIRADRNHALRTVPVATQAGLASLVVSYRGDGDAPDVRKGTASLGSAEWIDVDAAVQYAVSRGAKRIVLFGWSMGASIALLVAERSELRSKIAGLVLIAPATDWRSIVDSGVKQKRLPGFVASLAKLMLSNPALSKVAGLEVPVDLDALDWVSEPSRGRLKVPTLVIHSSGDSNVPFTLTERFIEAQGTFATLFESATAEHALEYNVDPAAFDARVLERLRGIRENGLSAHLR